MLTKLDELYLPQHWHLTPADECYFSGDYTARRGYGHSQTNNLIFNLKKTVDRRGLPEWQYKIQAIGIAAAIFQRSMKPDFLRTATFVPVPPSKAPNDPLYDDRIVQVVRLLGENVDLRELVYQVESMEEAHTAEDRPGPNQLYANYRLQQDLLLPRPTHIAVVDDVLTTGAHFAAMKRIMSEVYPGVRIVGLFVARRVPDEDP